MQEKSPGFVTIPSFIQKGLAISRFECNFHEEFTLYIGILVEVSLNHHDLLLPDMFFISSSV